MHLLSTRRLPAGLVLIFTLAGAPAGAVEAPLSRASFERAIEEGRSCRRIEKAGPYIIKRGKEPPLAALFDRLLQAFLAEEISDSFVTVHLATPYTRVRQAACMAKLYGTPFDEDAAWDSARTTSTVGLDFLTTTFSQPTLPMTVDAEGRYGTIPGTLRSPGSPVIHAALQRGEGDGAILIPAEEKSPLEYVFPAAALQGRGPFFVVLQTEAPDGKVVLKLKPSLLKEP